MVETLLFTWAMVSGWPVAAANGSCWNGATNFPRWSGKDGGVNSSASSMVSLRVRTARAY
ncbi:hypothetical protein GCM10027174_19220 [Salinifilum aidingensis]